MGTTGNENDMKQPALSTDEQVEAFARRYPPIEGGRALRIEGDLELPLAMIESWRRQYQELNADFRRWCRANALTNCSTKKVLDYFGIADHPDFIVIDELSVSWYAYAEFRLRNWVQAARRMTGRPHASIRKRLEASPIHKIQKQLAFDLETGLDAIANPSLYPDIEFMRERLAIDLSEDDEAGTQSDANPILIESELRIEWTKQPETVEIVGRLKMQAARDYANFEYDPVRTYERFCKDMRAWCDRYFRKREYTTSEDVLAHIVERLAMRELIANEQVIVSAISQAVRIRKEEKPKLTQERLNKLKPGTLYKPS